MIIKKVDIITRKDIITSTTTNITTNVTTIITRVYKIILEAISTIRIIA